MARRKVVIIGIPEGLKPPESPVEVVNSDSDGYNLKLAARIVDALRSTYSVRLPVRGVLEFVSRERLIRDIAKVLETPANTGRLKI